MTIKILNKKLNDLNHHNLTCELEQSRINYKIKKIRL